MNLRDLAIIELMTGCCLLVGEDRRYVYEVANKLTGKTVFTHELPDISDEYHEQLINMYAEIYERIKIQDMAEESNESN